MSTSKPWYESLPTPKSSPAIITVDDLHSLLQHSGNRVVVIDVRRTDIEDPFSFMLPSAINLPAQTFYQTLPALLPLLSKSDQVVFHCSSSKGRGPRCAAWYEDALIRAGLSSNSVILSGGITAWSESYPDELVKI